LLARGFKPVRFNALQDQTVVAAASDNGSKSARNNSAVHNVTAGSEEPHGRHRRTHK